MKVVFTCQVCFFCNVHSGTVIREEVGLSLDRAGSEVLGHAGKVVLSKDSTTIVGDGSTQEAVNKRIAQIKRIVEVQLCFIDISDVDQFVAVLTILPYWIVMQATEQDYEKEKLNERIAKLSGGVAVIQVT